MQWKSLSFNQIIWHLMTEYGGYKTYYRSAEDKVNTCDIIKHTFYGIVFAFVIALLISVASGAVLLALIQTVLMIFGLPLIVGELAKVAEVTQIIIAVLSCAALYAYVLEKRREARIAKLEKQHESGIVNEPSKAYKLIADCWESFHKKVCIEIDIDTLRK